MSTIYPLNQIDLILIEKYISQFSYCKYYKNDLRKQVNRK